MVRCGFRIFRCDDEHPSHTWKEPTRDCFSPSGEPCPICGAHTQPQEREHHPEWPLDLSLNLLADVDYAALTPRG